MKKGKRIRKQLLSEMLSFALVIGSVPVSAGESLAAEMELMTGTAAETEAVAEMEAATEEVTEVEAPEMKVAAVEAATEEVTEVEAPESETGAEIETPTTETEEFTEAETVTETEILMTETNRETVSEIAVVGMDAKVLQSAETNETEAYTVTVEVIPAEGLVYDYYSDGQTLVTGVNVTFEPSTAAQDYTVMYRLAGENYSPDRPEGKAAGTYLVKAQIATEDGRQFESEWAKCSITKYTLTKDVKYKNQIFKNTEWLVNEFIDSLPTSIYAHELVYNTHKFADGSTGKTAAGTYIVKPQLYPGEISNNLQVQPGTVQILPLNNCKIELTTQTLPFMNRGYSASEFVTSAKIDGLDKFVEGTDYKVSFADSSVETVKAAGKYRIKVEVINQDILNSVTWLENCGPSITAEVEIVKNTSTEWQATPAAVLYTADGYKAADLVSTVTYGGVTLTKGTDYTVSFMNGAESVHDAGNYRIKISAVQNSELLKNFATFPSEYTSDADFTIQPRSLSDSAVTIEAPEDVTYSNSAYTPDVTVLLDNIPLVKGIDYTVSYKDSEGNQVDEPIVADTYTVTITGKDNFTGERTTQFEIRQRPLTVTANAQTITYGENISQATTDVTAEGLADGDSVSSVFLTAENADVTDQGTVSVEVKSVRIKDSSRDVTANYAITCADGNLTIKPKSIIVDGITAVDRTYNAKSDVELDYGKVIWSGLVGTDMLAVSAVGTVEDKNIGTNKKVMISDITLSDGPGGSGKASNYVIDTENSQKETTVNITPKTLSIILEVADKQYDGLDTAVIIDAGLEGLEDSDDVALNRGQASFMDTQVAADIPVSFTEFTIEGQDAGNYTLVQPSGITADIYNTYDAAEYIVTPEEWTNGTVAVKAADGYLISAENRDDSIWSQELTYSETTAEEGETVTVYLRNQETKAISLAEEVTYFIDKIHPTGTISIQDGKKWQEFVDEIAFDTWYRDMKVVEITAADTLSGVKSIEYYESSSAMTQDEVTAITDWKPYTEGVTVTLEDARKYVYFARITDVAGNVTYLSTDGAVYDTTLPEITGVTDGETYYTTQNVKIYDVNLEKVTLNGIEQTIKYGILESTPTGIVNLVLEGNKEAVYEITATDKAGNTAAMKVTMKPIRLLSEEIRTVTDENLTPKDREKIEQVKEVLAAVDTTDATEEEKDTLKKAKENCDTLIGILDQAQEEADHAVETMEDRKKDKADAEGEAETGTKADAEDREAARTGDNTDILLWVSMLLLSMAAMLGVLTKLLMRRKEQ